MGDIYLGLSRINCVHIRVSMEPTVLLHLTNQILADHGGKKIYVHGNFTAQYQPLNNPILTPKSSNPLVVPSL